MNLPKLSNLEKQYLKAKKTMHLLHLNELNVNKHAPRKRERVELRFIIAKCRFELLRKELIIDLISNLHINKSLLKLIEKDISSNLHPELLQRQLKLKEELIGKIEITRTTLMNV